MVNPVSELIWQKINNWGKKNCQADGMYKPICLGMSIRVGTEDRVNSWQSSEQDCPLQWQLAVRLAWLCHTTALLSKSNKHLIQYLKYFYKDSAWGLHVIHDISQNFKQLVWSYKLLEVLRVCWVALVVCSACFSVYKFSWKSLEWAHLSAWVS